MTSKLVVNTIESDTGISSVSFASSISMSSTSKFFFSDAGIDIGADTNINRPSAGVLGFNINSSEKVRITSAGNVGIGTNNPTKLLELFGTDPTIKLMDSSGDAYALIEGDSADQGSIRFRADPLGAGSGTHIRFDTDGTERLRITSNGQLVIGHTASHAIDIGHEFRFQVSGTNFPTSGISQQRFQNASSGASLALAHSRNDTQGSHTALQSNDEYGKIRFYGSDGTDFDGYGAAIVAKVDGAVGVNSTPGRLEFHTTASGSNDATEKLRITKNGRINIGDTDQTQDVDQFSVTVAAANALDNVARFQSTAAASGTSETLVKIYKGAGYGGVVSGYITQGSDHGLKFYTANNGTLSEGLRATSNGIIDAPTQAGFYARMQNTKSSVMGGGASYYTVPFDTDSGSICYDTHNTYNTSTGLYTVPSNATGHYMLATAVCLSSNVGGRGGEAWFIQGSNRYFFDRRFMTSTSGTITGFYGTSIIYLSAGQSIGVQGFISGGNQNVDVQGANATDQITWFTARKIA